MEHYSVTLTHGWQCEYAILQTRLAKGFWKTGGTSHITVCIFLGEFNAQLGSGFKLQSRRCFRQTVHTHCASVHPAAKLVAALIMVAGVTVGLVESNGSLPLGL